MNIGLLASVLGVDVAGCFPRSKQKEELSPEELETLQNKAQAKRDRRNAKRLAQKKG